MEHTCILYEFQFASRCEIPEGTQEEAKLQLLVSWIIDNPAAVADEEVCGDGGVV
jgi:hypothetical protein